MKKLNLATLLWLTVLATTYAQAQSKTQRQPPPPKRPPLVTNTDITRPPKPDAGVIVEQTYLNDFFGLSLTFPKDWFVLNETGLKEVQQRGKDLVKAETPQEAKQKAEIERTVDQRTINLLGVRQYLATPPGQINASLLVIAELLPARNVTAQQYVKAMKDGMLPRFTIHFDVTQDVTAEQLSGHEAAVMQLQRATESGSLIKQEYHAVVIGDYALSFILTYSRDEQRELLHTALATLKLESRK